MATTVRPTPAQTTRYDIDVHASRITFRARHLFGLATVHGTLAVRNGTINLAEPTAGSTVWAEIDVSSLQTDDSRRDKSLRSPRFLDADRYPVMTFSADSFDDPMMTGTLTVCDVTCPVTVTIDRRDLADDVITVSATARIDRTVYGVTALRALVGRYLTVGLEVRCVRR